MSTKDFEGAGSKFTMTDAERAANDARAKVFELPTRVKAEGVLFDFERKDGELQGANDPLMTGNILFALPAVGADAVAGELIRTQVFLSAFRKQAKHSGNAYLSLSLGVEGGVRYYGNLFNNIDSPDRKPTSPDYSGYLKVLPVRMGGDGAPEQHSPESWDAAPQVQIYGSRERSEAGKAYISLALRTQRDTRPVGNDEIKF